MPGTERGIGRVYKKVAVSLLSGLLVFSSSVSTLVFAAMNEQKDENYALIQKHDNKMLKKSISQSDLVGKKKLAMQAARAAFSKKNQEKYVPGELIVKYKNNTVSTKVRTKHSLKSLKKLKAIDAEVVKVQTGTSMDSQMEKLEADPSVEYVQPNYLYKPSALPNDPSFNQLWGLHNTGQKIANSIGAADMDIDYPEAMQEFSKLSNPSQTVVAVIDTGVDINHPDLQADIWTNPGEIAGNGKDDDGNGYVDDVHGWDFLHHDNSVFDAADGDEHGTHVAGTIAASSNNGLGITGIAPNVKIMPLKFLGPDGGSTADAISAIDYAAKMGVKISNNSWGGSDNDQALKDAIERSNMLFVTAAGNDGKNIDSNPDYPASFTSPNIISVAAIDNTGKLADFSNYGTRGVDIAAPGVSILSTVPKKLEAGVSAQINNSANQYKAIVNGFGFENFTSTDRPVAFKKALDYLGVTPDSKILLVQDDESDDGYPSFLKTYEDLLQQAGITNYKEVTVSTDNSGPDAATLSSYDSVIWFSGYAMGNHYPTLTNNDLTSLDQFLKKGNKSLLLSGEDLLYQNEDSSFVTNTLSLHITGEGAARTAVGVAGTIYDGGKYPLGYAPYTDYFTSNNPNLAKINLLFPAETNYNDAYDYFDGTSMATPHVTGVAALLAGKYPSFDAEQLKKILLASGDSLSSLNTKILGGKKLNAYKALTYFRPTVSQVTERSNSVMGTAEPGATVTIKIGDQQYTAVADRDGHFTVAIPVQKAGTVLSVSAGDAGDVVNVKVADITVPAVTITNTVSNLAKEVIGKTEAGATVTVVIGSTSYKSASNSSGNFKVVIPVQKAGTKLTVAAKDAAGHVSSVKTITVVDKIPPASIKVKSVSNLSRTVSGATEKGTSITVLAGSKKYYGKADSYGNFKVGISSQKAGAKLTVTAKDAAGNARSIPVTVTDKKPPAAPKVKTVAKSATKYLNGTAESGSMIVVKVGHKTVGTTKTDSHGKFKVKIKAQKKKTVLTVTATDQAKNVSTATKIKVK